MNTKKIFKYKKAFTLAEVLVSLTILGVIAALTIPSLIQTYDDEQATTKLRKTYSNFSQVFNNVMLEPDITLKDVCDETDTTALTSCYIDELSEKVAATRTCKSSNDCFHQPQEWAFLGGNECNWDSSHGFILNDGTLVRLEITSNECNETVTPGIQNKCGELYVDINGFEDPNEIGRDIFGFHVLDINILPFGTDNDNYYPDKCDYNSNFSENGIGCTTKVLYPEMF